MDNIASEGVNATSTIVEVKKIKYSIMDKWLGTGVESRINRRQYIGRIIGGSIIISLFVFAILIQGLNLIGSSFLGRFIFVIPLIITLSWSIIVWLIIRIQSIKRCHDFGNDAKIITRVITLIIILFTITSLYNILGNAGLITDYVTSLEAAFAGSYKLLTYPIHQTMMIYIGYISQTLWFIILLVLSFIKGDNNDNLYGGNPIFTKGS